MLIEMQELDLARGDGKFICSFVMKDFVIPRKDEVIEWKGQVYVLYNTKHILRDNIQAGVVTKQDLILLVRKVEV